MLLFLPLDYEFLAGSFAYLEKVKSLSHVQLFEPPWTVAYQVPLSVGFFQVRVLGTGVGCHFLLQRIFPNQGLNPGLPHCRQTLYCLRHQGSLTYLVP